MDFFWSLPNARALGGLEEPLDALFAASTVRRYEPGATISTADEAPHRVFRCVRGTVKVTKLLASGREILIAVLREGAVYSDRALLSGYWRDVYLYAIETAEIATAEIDPFQRLVRQRPDTLASFMLQISDQISETLVLLDDFRGRDVASRLARVLVRFGRQFGTREGDAVRVDLPITHQDLANMIGTARETVSRNMARFRDQGYVRDGHAAALEILSVEGLEALIA